MFSALPSSSSVSFNGSPAKYIWVMSLWWAGSNHKVDVGCSRQANSCGIRGRLDCLETVHTVGVRDAHPAAPEVGIEGCRIRATGMGDRPKVFACHTSTLALGMGLPFCVKNPAGEIDNVPVGYPGPSL